MKIRSKSLTDICRFDFRTSFLPKAARNVEPQILSNVAQELEILPILLEDFKEALKNGQIGLEKRRKFALEANRLPPLLYSTYCIH